MTTTTILDQSTAYERAKHAARQRGSVLRACRLAGMLARAASEYHIEVTQVTTIMSATGFGAVDMEAQVRTVDDLLRLAYATHHRVTACPAGISQMQAYIELVRGPGRLTVCWLTPEVAR